MICISEELINTVFLYLNILLLLMCLLQKSHKTSLKIFHKHYLLIKQKKLDNLC